MHRFARVACLGAAMLFLGCTVDQPLQSPTRQTNETPDAYQSSTLG